ncbi:MAG: MATE family efflux transporter [Oscillospiraceae bacterium]|jgi:putative MATE family efflux protein|nr:MATE family efflux transporter [Oscillospiraceae bacterium]
MTHLRQKSGLTPLFRKLFAVRDMTTGNPLGAMMRFSVPLLIGNIAQLMYSTVDSLVLGRYVSADALSAAGTSTPIQNLFFVFYMTVGSGVSIVVSQYFGAKDKENLSVAVGTSLVMALIATLSITALGIPLSGVMLRAIKVHELGGELFSLSHSYLMIMFAGAVGVGFYNILSGILRGMGDSVFPLMILLLTSVMNVALDLLFVVVFDLSVAGAAWATVISQTASAVICLLKLLRMKNTVGISRRTLRPHKTMVRHILRIGLPSGVQQVVLSSSYVFVQRLINGIVVFDAAGNQLDKVFVAAATAFSRVDALAMLPSQAFSLGGSTFAGQNIGAHRLDRVKQGFRIITVATMATSIVLFAAVYLFGGKLIGLFIKPDEPHFDEIVRWGVYIQRIMVWDYIIMAFLQPAGGVLRGAGDTLPVMFITVICTVLMRVPLAYVWVTNTKTAEFPGGGPAGIYWSMVICFAIAAGSCLIYYATGRWKRKAIV